MTFLIMVLFSLIILILSLYLASFHHPPKFHHNRQDYIDLLQNILSGQANYDQWSSIIHLPIRHDLDLEKIRQQCVQIEALHYLGHPTQLGKPEGMFTAKGLLELEVILKEMQSNIETDT